MLDPTVTAAISRIQANATAASAQAYRLLLQKRALARTDAELFGNRSLYESCIRELATELIGAGA